MHAFCTRRQTNTGLDPHPCTHVHQQAHKHWPLKPSTPHPYMHAFTHKHTQAHKHQSLTPSTPHPCLHAVSHTHMPRVFEAFNPHPCMHAITHMHPQAHKHEPSKTISACLQGAGATNTHTHITNIQLQTHMQAQPSENDVFQAYVRMLCRCFIHA